MSLSSVTGGAPGGRHSATKWVGTTAAVLDRMGYCLEPPVSPVDLGQYEGPSTNEPSQDMRPLDEPKNDDGVDLDQ